MSVILDQRAGGPKATRRMWGLSEQPAVPPDGPLVVAPERSGPGGYLLAWTVPLLFCSGLCGLAVSSVLEVAVPRWFILASGVVCALLVLLAPLVNWSCRKSPSGREARTTSFEEPL
jgi:hypothetical protein